MSEPGIDAPSTQSVGLCGFSRCRAHLPAPGPKGGRPVEYCPDRTWPGGKTCKQLAAAQDALAQALGEPADAPALTAAAAELAEAGARIHAPLADVLAALETIRTTTAAELTAAAARVQESEDAATRERGLREQTDQRATQADTDAETARAAADLADHQADNARTEQRAAQEQTVQARKDRDEAIAARREAECAKDKAETDRQRAVDQLAAAHEQITGLQTTLAAERAAALAQLDQVRRQDHQVQADLRARLTTEHEQRLRDRAEEFDRQTRLLRAAADQRAAELAEATRSYAGSLGQFHQQLSAARVELGAQTTAGTALRAQLDALQAGITRALAHPTDEQLRHDMAALLQTSSPKPEATREEN
ncbi:hypothetical protein F0L68_31595 [Solihabitans fulvus]|uniref:Chromosome segregation ATPase n=1 Tax=Solihabitans fulvus TaxID=1892852 RepID=A0A5B2WQ13_9PSEU|nr:hypothetical protein [Solihabitans fulvus]KAA2253831.1 hypothetical protein F0L68_31595 [Solihabitans fulvus]